MTVVGAGGWRALDQTNAGPELGLRAYCSEVVVLPDSKLVGQTLAESGFGHDFDFTVLRIVRQNTPTLAPRAHTVVQAGDILLVEGAPDELLKVKDTAGIEIKADLKLGDPILPEEGPRHCRSHSPAEIATAGTHPQRHWLPPRSLCVAGARNQSARANSSSQNQRTPPPVGDILLMQGPKSDIAAMEEDRTFRVIQTLAERQPKRRRAPIAIAIFLGVLALATVKVVPFSVAVILGSVAAFLTKCITPDEAYRELEWKAVILIGSMLALGAAMEQTGAARYLAGLIVQLADGHGATWLLAGWLFCAHGGADPTDVESGSGCRGVADCYLQTALQLGLNQRTFAMMVAVAASCSYLTPLEPSCLMVYGPGGYKFSDSSRSVPYSRFSSGRSRL